MDRRHSFRPLHEIEVLALSLVFKPVRALPGHLGLTPTHSVTTCGFPSRNPFTLQIAFFV
jgi:hypothetical protein